MSNDAFSSLTVRIVLTPSAALWIAPFAEGLKVYNKEIVNHSYAHASKPHSYVKTTCGRKTSRIEIPDSCTA